LLAYFNLKRKQVIFGRRKKKLLAYLFKPYVKLFRINFLKGTSIATEFVIGFV
jgi:hypothetical protein